MYRTVVKNHRSIYMEMNVLCVSECSIYMTPVSTLFNMNYYFMFQFDLHVEATISCSALHLMQRIRL